MIIEACAIRVSVKPRWLVIMWLRRLRCLEMAMERLIAFWHRLNWEVVSDLSIRPLSFEIPTMDPFARPF